MKNDGFSVYLEATFERNFKELLDRNTLNYSAEIGNDRLAFSQNSIEGLNSFTTFQKPPETEEELKKAIDLINRETDDVLSTIEKIKLQISNFQTNNSDYNKSRTAMTDTKTQNSGKVKINLSNLLILLTLALIIGGWVDKIIS